MKTEGVGISLFNVIPKNRSCADAIIPRHHCTCMERVDKDFVFKKDAEVKILSELKTLYADSYFTSPKTLSN